MARAWANLTDRETVSGGTQTAAGMPRVVICSLKGQLYGSGWGLPLCPVDRGTCASTFDPKILYVERCHVTKSAKNKEQKSVGGDVRRMPAYHHLSEKGGSKNV